MSLFYTNETNTLKNHQEKVGDIMTFLKPINRRVGSLFAVAALVLATVTPGLVPAFASAAQVTERSVELSSSSKTATGVVYTVKFTGIQTAGAVVLDFCSNSPLIGAECTAPAGFNASTATTTTSGFTIGSTDPAANNRVVLTGSVLAAANELNVTGVTNPAAAGPLYVRIVTYTNQASAEAYESEDLKANVRDQGSAAVSITDSIGVSGAVRESMTFCVSGQDITQGNCGGGLTAPTLQLGEGSGAEKALSSSAVSTGSIYSQISTNAASGAVVNLKSSATGCGGLLRIGDTTNACDIVPAVGANEGIAVNQARFGVRVAGIAGPSTNAAQFGTFRAANDVPYYSDSVFKLNWQSGDATGITSPFGDPFLDTDGGPVSDKNVQITFGASVTNNTPAGLYSTDLSLIATGKF